MRRRETELRELKRVSAGLTAFHGSLGGALGGGMTAKLPLGDGRSVAGLCEEECRAAATVIVRSHVARAAESDEIIQ